RTALAAGAGRAVAVTWPDGAFGDGGAPSEAAAAALAAALAQAGASAVFCGDASLDRGSGSVPAFLAAHLGAAQALGVLRLDLGAEGAIEVERRLDQGRRERLVVPAGVPGVISVEAGSARLRRAALGALLAAQSAEVTVVPAPAAMPAGPVAIKEVGAFRPPARVVRGPSPSLGPGERIRQLAGVLQDRKPPRLLTLPPGEAAEMILVTLRGWGELQ
ncbi:MAG: hypothetical protein ACRD0B_01385, partial [Acidimicrobiales bacterium]